ncbi:hypothetical protein C8R46DRAFT_984939 [Mycena filopes]|nr:hypothetical protein C8R46DRAFT_984939 [Mycena filopes]
MSTHRHPEGILTQSRILPLLADLGAIRKIAGFLSHSATMFCSFCLLKLKDIERLDHEAWEHRSGDTVKAQGALWLTKTTIKARNAWSTLTGVRWTPMHDLVDWDPVQHTVLGFMHNSLEGHAAEQLRSYWGIGRQSALEKDIKEQEKEETFSESDTSEAGDDLASLEEEMNTPLEDLMDLDAYREQTRSHSSEDGTPTPAASLPTAPLSSAPPAGAPLVEVDENYVPPGFDSTAGSFDFTDKELAIIRQCIKDVHLPTWVGRPPTNLGEAAHGTLKAQELLILFTVIFPLIIPELWWEKSDLSQRLLDNSHHFTACINIISCFSTSNAAAAKYAQHFGEYRKGLQELWPRIASKPNHHLGMHNPELLRFWGPLATISEFPGERMIGQFGRVKTNRRIYDMDFTMVRHMARRGRFEAMLHERNFQADESSAQFLTGLAQILEPEEVDLKNPPLQPLTGLEIAKILGRGKEIPDEIYTALLAYLHSAGQPNWRSHTQSHGLHFPAADLVLPPSGLCPSDVKLEGRTFSCKQSHKGNSGIQFKSPLDFSVRLTGFINTIWQIPLQGRVQTFFVVEKHTAIPLFLLRGTPYLSMPEFATTVVDAAPSNEFVIIESEHILTHLTVLERPRGTYGIDTRSLLTICWSLNRGRRS